MSFGGEGLYEPFDLSAVERLGNHIVLGSDEGNVIQVLERTNTNTFVLKRKYSIPDGEETDRKNKGKHPELDIEGIAAENNTVYIVSSHSSKRKKVKPENPKGRSYSENRKRLAEIEDEENRRTLIKLKFDDEGKIQGKPKEKDIWDVIENFDELKPFTKVPSKENGVDIEGIAVWDEKLYIGFRGPVLRENWVPVMVTAFDEPTENANLRFVNLGGLGIRDIVAVEKELFLLIAGPMGNGLGDYHLYAWNGLDCVPGKNGAKGTIRHIGKIPAGKGAKAEGLAILNDKTDALLQLLVVFDGPKNGNPILLEWRR